MKTFVSILVVTVLTTLSANADLAKDRESILKMAGCFDVQFDFVETFLWLKNHPVTSAPYTERGTELVFIDKETPTEIHLQHILVMPGNGAMKHWRQEWRFESADLWTFEGRKNFSDKNSSLVWSKSQSPIKTGYWKQTVTQVDDSPRYECSAPWIHTQDSSYWECKSPAPLPRREFTKRDDYDILNRRNRHAITDGGWMHEQDNEKIISQPRTLVAEEKGYNAYKHSDPVNCQGALTWWQDNKLAWNNIQELWYDISKNETSLVLKGKVGGQTLWMELFALGDEFTASTTKDLTKLKTDASEIITKFRE